jgi:hypothetical protein
MATTWRRSASWINLTGVTDEQVEAVYKEFTKNNQERRRKLLIDAGCSNSEVTLWTDEQVISNWLIIQKVIVGEVPKRVSKVGEELKVAAAGIAETKSETSELIKLMMLQMQQQQQQQQLLIQQMTQQEHLRREERERDEAVRREELELRRGKMRQQKELDENRLRVESDNRRFEADRRERREKEAAERISRETRERAESKEVRIKHFGDILKRVMTQMPANVMDVPMYLEGVERMFVEYSVPADIQTVLLNPYLSDKAKRLMVRLPVTETRT